MSELVFNRRTSRSRGLKTSERVAREIVKDVVAKELPPGAPLPGEAAMLEIYGVSRSSLREALRILEANGLVQLRPGPGGGPFINGVSPEHFGRATTLFLEMSRTTYGELLEARCVMEPLMARLAAERHDAARLEELSDSLGRHRDLDLSAPEDYVDTTQDFHGVIAGLSGNGVLDLFGRSLKEIFTIRVLESHQPPARWEAIQAEHEAIAQAVLDGDPELAERLMREHMIEFARSFRSRYGDLLGEVVGWL